jgi:cytochrome c peroxidase
VIPLLLAIPLGLDLYMPVPEDNPLTTEKIALGRRLFQDRRLSRDHSTSCASCHDPKRAFSDGRAVAVGVFGRNGRRNAPALVNRGYGRLFFWDGRVRTLEEQVLKPIEDPNEMDLTLAEVSSRMKLPADQIARALASYIRSILSGNSAFDRFINGDRSALSPEQQLGLQVFRGKGNCIACHVGPNFTDESLHNTGVAWRDGTFMDPGAGQGNFKTPTLREVARTAPYMHDGSLATTAAGVRIRTSTPRSTRSISPLPKSRPSSSFWAASWAECKTGNNVKSASAALRDRQVFIGGRWAFYRTLWRTNNLRASPVPSNTFCSYRVALGEPILNSVSVS